MQSLRSRLPTLAIVAAAILCAATAWGLANAAADTPHATHARNDRTEILRLYEKTRLLELTKADGRVIKKLPIVGIKQCLVTPGNLPVRWRFCKLLWFRRCVGGIMLMPVVIDVPTRETGTEVVLTLKNGPYGD